MERLYFSKQNYNIVYNILKNKIYKNTEFDISSNQVFEKELINIMKTIYSKRNDYNFPDDIKDIDKSRYLSQKVINISNVYFMDNINNYKTKKAQLQEKNLVDKKIKNDINKISQRPLIEEINKKDIKKRYEDLINNRAYVKKTPQVVDFTNNDEFNSEIVENIPKRINNYNDLIKERNLELSNNFGENMDRVNDNIRKKNELGKQNNNATIVSTQVNPNITNDNYKISETASNAMKEDTISNYEALMTNMTVLSDINQETNTDMTTQFALNVIDKTYSDEQKKDNMKEIFPHSQYAPDKKLNDAFNFNNHNLEELNKLKIATVVEQTVDNNNQVEIHPEPSNIDNDLYKILRDDLKDTLNETVTNNKDISNNILKLSQELQNLPSLLNNIPNKIESLLNTKRELEIKEFKLIINSGDRDFTSDTGEFSKYNFSINFGDNLNNVRSVDSDGNSVVYESTSKKNPHVQTVLKNVQSIRLDKVIIPKPNDDVYLADPFYYVSIEELDSNVITSKRFPDKIFSKVTFDKAISFGGISNSNKIADSSDDDRKFLYYKNDTNDNQIYNPPKAVINKLTIKLLNPRGKVMSEIWLDTDFTTLGPANASDEFTLANANFNYNTFKNDQIEDIVEETIYKVSAIDYSNNPDKVSFKTIIGGSIGTGLDNKNIINLSNQIQYFFTVTTTNRLDIIE